MRRWAAVVLGAVLATGALTGCPGSACREPVSLDLQDGVYVVGSSDTNAGVLELLVGPWLGEAVLEVRGDVATLTYTEEAADGSAGAEVRHTWSLDRPDDWLSEIEEVGRAPG